MKNLILGIVIGVALSVLGFFVLKCITNSNIQVEEIINTTQDEKIDLNRQYEKRYQLINEKLEKLSSNTQVDWLFRKQIIFRVLL